MDSTPPAVAITNGHTLEWDPPAAMTAADRWTCTVCGRAALRYSGNEYGGAVSNPCTQEG